MWDTCARGPQSDQGDIRLTQITNNIVVWCLLSVGSASFQSGDKFILDLRLLLGLVRCLVLL